MAGPRIPRRKPAQVAALLRCALAFGLLLLALLPARSVWAQTSLTVASLEARAPMWKELDAAFVAQYKKMTGRDVRIEHKSGPSSSAQVKAVRQGLAADVVALDDAADVDALIEPGLVAADWRNQFPQDAAPWATTVVFVVREGNPKRIREWTDLSKAGVEVVLADPRTDALGRAAWLGGWGIVQRRNGGSGGDTRAVERFASRWLANAAPLASDRQAAIERFARQGAGDVLLAFESDASKIEQAAAAQQPGGRKLALVVPASSLRVDQPVALVSPVTRKKGSGELARAYLTFMYGEAAARIAALHGLRPTSEALASEVTARYFPKPLRWFSVAELFGSRAQAEQAHFGARGWFDKLGTPRAAMPSSRSAARRKEG